MAGPDRLISALEGRYRIERELGAGGMATVYLAHDVKHDRKVALKVLRPELGAVLGGERFLSEIRLTANLQHPHILALYDSGTADGLLHYVRPYVDGETVREKLDREKQLGVDEAMEYRGRLLMQKIWWLPVALSVGLAVAVLEACAQADRWVAEFPVPKDDLTASGRNPYFILEPGYTLVLEGGNAELIITVLHETTTVDGVETRVVEERERRDGRLIEVSRNYFAMSRRTGDVFYFGEDVDMYRGGEVVSHTGAWLSGVGGAKFGLMMPGRVALHARYYQEVAPEVAMDRAVIVSLRDTCNTPAGVFPDCLKVEETTPLQPGVVEYKYYAPGVGMVQDGPLKLVRVEGADRSEE